MPLAQTLFRVVCCLIVGVGFADAKGRRVTKSLLDDFDAATHVVKGDWELLGGQLRAIDPTMALAVLPGEIAGPYSLRVEFTRTSGDDAVGVIVPVGSRQCILNLAVFKGEAHGIAAIDGALARDNISTIRPGKLENGRRYRLDIDVAMQGENWSIDSKLDGQPFLKWTGADRSLDLLSFWKLPRTDAVGLFANADVVFHAVSLQGTPAMKPATTPSEPASELIQFEGKRWRTTNAKQVNVETYRGKTALHVVGGESSFIPIVADDFDNGTIDVDIASATFSGIGFRANKPANVAELVYLRPFNSSTAKHENTVQYAIMGSPQFGWQALRRNSPGKYESGANVTVNRWFHLKVVVDNRRLTAFIDNEPQPVLTIDRTLGDTANGAVGVWGWDSYFANFETTPAN